MTAIEELTELRNELAALRADASRWRKILESKTQSWGFIGMDPSRECVKIEVPLAGEPIWTADDTFDWRANLIAAVDALPATTAVPDEHEDQLRCPECGNITGIQGWDCLGADDDKLFCNQCNREVVPQEMTDAR